MSNSLFNIFNQNQQQNPMIAQFEQFKRQFTGDPKAQVQALLNSGRMTQAQYNQLSQMATQFMKMIGK